MKYQGVYEAKGTSASRLIACYKPDVADGLTDLKT